MDVKTFQRILSMVTPYLKPKKMTRPTDGISPNQKLAAVLEYFACGSLQRHIASVYRINYIDSSGNLIEGEWRNNIPAKSLFSSTINPTQGRPTDIGKTTRDSLKEFLIL
ncbi:uncharacterized protein LOC119648433 [Hermetia illucens]|uniref:uncharacterized protein LOC119648433 n=1 Tax=Hermetia illucens TaxID=343691 RepID=UPI0018CC56ED|nr:uncharacterized protein LOC119648433 [Hermetia illucens]